METINSEIPIRSQFYQIEPIGIWKDEVENLTSYINRLCAAHLITNYSFFSRYIEPRFGEDIRKIIPSFEDYKVFGHLSVNRGITSGVIANILSEATMIEEIKDLTLLPYDSLLKRACLTRNKQFCPCCYLEWKNAKQEIHDKLIWEFKVITSCIKHKCLLIDHCYKCQKKIRALTPRLFLGFCEDCGEFLGGEYTKKNFSKEELTWEKWKYDNISSLLCLSKGEKTTLPDKDEIASKIRKINKTVYEAGYIRKDIVDALSVQRHTFERWEQNSLTLENLLKYCYVLSITLKEFLFNEVKIKSIVKMPTFKISSKKEKLDSGIIYKDRTQISEKLNNLIKEKEYPPPSVMEIHNRLSYKSKNCLYKSFPKEIKILGERYKKYKAKQSEINSEKTKQEIEDIVKSLYLRGEYPSMVKVEKEMGRRVLGKVYYRKIYENAKENFKK